MEIGGRPRAIHWAKGGSLGERLNPNIIHAYTRARTNYKVNNDRMKVNHQSIHSSFSTSPPLNPTIPWLRHLNQYSTLIGHDLNSITATKVKNNKGTHKKKV